MHHIQKSQKKYDTTQLRKKYLIDGLFAKGEIKMKYSHIDRIIAGSVYFHMDEEARVFHMMGQTGETRHIVMKNQQTVISLSWSIHSGVGSKNYAFIWAIVFLASKVSDYMNGHILAIDGGYLDNC